MRWKHPGEPRMKNNIACAFTPDEIETTRRSGGLLSMELELSRACNLRCIYCYADSETALADELSLDEIFDAIDQAIELGARRIIVLGGGEPLVHPDILPILRHIHQRGAAIDLFTNATLITAELAREFMALGVCPVIKMNSRREGVQDMLADRAGTFTKIQRGLDHLRRAGYPREDRILGVQTVICRQNLEELPDLWVWIREQGMVPYFETITLQGRARRHPELLVTPAKIQALFQTLSDLDRQRYGLDWTPHPPVAGLTCNRHFYTCTVTVRGDILPCPGVDIAVGSIRTTRLAEILRHSPVIRDLRNIRETIKGACRECEFHDSCYGCRGMAYQQTGDYLAADPLCWKNIRKA
jgi:radical SAM protein with 4Fe4S-binding SPASM domain